MKIKRLFTEEGINAFEKIEFEKRTSVIRNPDGSIVFEMPDITVPRQWSQVATDILAQKYFRRAGIPKFLKKAAEDNVPEWLQRSEPDTEKMENLPKEERFTFEKDSRQVFFRYSHAVVHDLNQDRRSIGLPVDSDAHDQAASSSRALDQRVLGVGREVHEDLQQFLLLDPHLGDVGVIAD